MYISFSIKIILMNRDVKIAVCVLLMFALCVNKRKFMSSQHYVAFQIFVQNSKRTYIITTSDR
jgi:hypothetical protein